MRTISLINTLVQRGAIVRLEAGAQLRVKPAAVLTDELRNEVRARKGEIVAFLEGVDAGPFNAPRTVTRAALERGLEVTSFGWPKAYYPADFRAELEAARQEGETQESGGVVAAESVNARPTTA
jgi:hypothetical protein